MQVCVTGANGFIGRYLVEALLHHGYTVRVLTREAGNIFPVSTQVIVGDLTKPDCPLDQFMNGCDILFHCAGEVRDVKFMRLLHVEGTKRLIKSVEHEYARSARKIHWVQLSSVGAYGPPISEPQTVRVITENTSTNPSNEYEISKTISDELVTQAGRGESMTYTILRPSNVFGTKMTNQSLRRLIQMVKRKQFFYVGKPGAVTTYVHVNDVVSALVICGVNPCASGQIYNLSSDCVLEELVKYIALCIGVQEPRLRIPAPLVRISLRLLSVFLASWVHVPSTNVLVLRTRYPADRIQTELGFEFLRPMPNGVKDMVTELMQ